MTQDIFICHSCGEGVLIASSEGMAGILLEDILQCTGQLPTVKNDLTPNVSLAETGKSWPKETSEAG